MSENTPDQNVSGYDSDQVAEQYADLRKQLGISITSLTREVVDGVIIVTVSGKSGDGRLDVSTGAVSIEGVTGQEKASAFMGAETKAKRRLTTSLGGKVPQGPAPTGIEKPAPLPQPVVNDAPAAETVDERHPESLPAVASVNSTQTGIAGAMPVLVIETNPALFAQPDEMVTFNFDSSEPDHLPEAPEVKRIETTQFPASSVPEVEPELNALLEAEKAIPTASAAAPTNDLNRTCTNVEFKDFTGRCMKLVRDVLPKVTKQGNELLLAHLRKTFGVQDLRQAPLAKWTSELERIEKAGSPAAILRIIKG